MSGTSTKTTKPIGFDRETYIRLQTEKIMERRERFGGKLYLEFGGKLFDDYHAARVLPGFTPDNKIEMLANVGEDVEIVVVISSHDLVNNKMRGDLGITYDADLLRLIDEFQERGLYVGSVVISQIGEHQSAVRRFKRKLERLGLKVYRHYNIKGYPANLDHIVSPEGFGRNDYIETTRDLVVVTAPGPASGKMATCLSQLYHDHERGITSGYAKFETFPIWNLPLTHPINMAYEAATADLDDVNMIDPYHLAAYGQQVVNYNRDVEVFPVLNRLLARVLGESPYKSPTDMGVNMVGQSICDDDVCRRASEQEIIRRYFKTLVEEKREDLDPIQSDHIALLMSSLGLKDTDRPVVPPARRLGEKTRQPASAIELPDGKIITGKTSPLLGPCSGMLLNTLKYLAGIDDEIDLLARDAIEPIQKLKTRHLGSRNPRLHTDEVLIALAVSANHDDNARLALEQLATLKGCDVHSTVILGSVDEGILRNLGVHVTCEPVYATKRLYRKR